MAGDRHLRIDTRQVGRLIAEARLELVLGHDGRHSGPGLEAALGTGAAYIAFIASARKEADRLREEILLGKFEPGEALPEIPLAERFEWEIGDRVALTSPISSTHQGSRSGRSQGAGWARAGSRSSTTAP